MSHHKIQLFACLKLFTTTIIPFSEGGLIVCVGFSEDGTNLLYFIRSDQVWS